MRSCEIQIMLGPGEACFRIEHCYLTIKHAAFRLIVTEPKVSQLRTDELGWEALELFG